LEWPAEVRRGWRPISSPHIFMTVESVRTSDISDLEMICAMGDSNWLKFDWVGYIRWVSDISISRGVQPFLNPMKIEQIRLIRYIRWGIGFVRPGPPATVLEPDGGSDMSVWSDMFDRA
jgi:hypothetical protein